MTEIFSWVATIATIGGALLTASNLGTRITGTGFVVFLFGSLSWLVVGISTHQPALIWTDAALTFLNVFGIWRWLGRQAAVEEGAQVAADSSRANSAEALFPASLFSNGKVFDTTGKAMAKVVDAMLDRQSGKPRYLVISQGGMAGAGETFRRLPWLAVSPTDGGFDTAIVADELAGFEVIDKDRWPAH